MSQTDTQQHDMESSERLANSEPIPPPDEALVIINPTQEPPKIKVSNSEGVLTDTEIDLTVTERVSEQQEVVESCSQKSETSRDQEKENDGVTGSVGDISDPPVSSEQTAMEVTCPEEPNITNTEDRIDVEGNQETLVSQQLENDGKEEIVSEEASAYRPMKGGVSPPSTDEKMETEPPTVTTQSKDDTNNVVCELGSSIADEPTSSIVGEVTEKVTVALPPTSEASSSSGVEASSANTPSTSNSQGACANEPAQSVYHVKWVNFKNNNVAIVTQNENGPCPLLAIINVLLLQGKIKLPAMIQIVTSGQLMEYLGDCILEQAPKNISEDALLNYEQNMSDAMAVFHKLQTGLDVNVRFTGVGDFEYTPECIVFDLLAIPLYHGWLVDPESPEVVAAVGNCSYNQLVEKIIAQKNSSKEELVTEALIAENFLERTASQLTYHGLCELVTTVKEDELCVFFRNNHFSTLYKHKNELFVMVTDQGFLTEPNVVWETLSNVEGDCYFVDANFRNFTKPEPSTEPIPLPTVPAGTESQIDQDYLVALSLQQEQQIEEASWQDQQQHRDNHLPQRQLSDHELAVQLQAEEDRRDAALQQQQQQQQQQKRQQDQQRQQQQQPSQEKDKKKSECVIL